MVQVYGSRSRYVWLIAYRDERGITAPPYLDGSGQRYAPGVGVALDTPRVTGEISAEYVHEDKPRHWFYLSGSSRGWRAEANLALRVTGWLTAMLMGDCEQKFYVRDEGRTATNAYVSASVSARF